MLVGRIVGWWILELVGGERGGWRSCWKVMVENEGVEVVVVLVL